MTLMHEHDRQHVNAIIHWLAEATYNKYAAGITEHGGHLPAKAGLLAEAEAEGLDLAVYLRTVRGQLEAILAALVAGYTLEATVALRLLLYGDPGQNLPSTVIKP